MWRSKSAALLPLTIWPATPLLIGIKLFITYNATNDAVRSMVLSALEQADLSPGLEPSTLLATAVGSSPYVQILVHLGNDVHTSV